MQPSQALVQVEYQPAQAVGLLAIPGCEFSATGLQLADGLPFNQWDRIGRILSTVEQAVGWWIGDWIRYGESSYGEKYAQAAALTGYATQTLMNMAFVASRFEISRRRENLSFTVHSEVAGLPEPEQDALLERVSSEGFKQKELRQTVKLLKAEKQAKQSGKFFDANIEAARIYWERLRPQLDEFQQIFPPAAFHVPTFKDDVDEALQMSFTDPPRFILEALEQQPRTTSELLKATGYHRDTLEALLRELEAAGSIAELEQGQITEMARGAVQTIWTITEG